MNVSSPQNRVWAWAKARLLPAAAGATLPFYGWATLNVLRGETWGLIGGPVLNWVVMMGMGTVWANCLLLAAFVSDRFFEPAQNLEFGRQFVSHAVGAAIALPALALLPLNEASAGMVAVYVGGTVIVIAALSRFLAGRWLAESNEDAAEEPA